MSMKLARKRTAVIVEAAEAAEADEVVLVAVAAAVAAADVGTKKHQKGEGILHTCFLLGFLTCLLVEPIKMV